MADFTWEYTTCEESRNAHVLVTTFEGQTEQRRLKSSAALVNYKLTFVNSSEADFIAITAFYDAKVGALTSFTWVDNHGATVTVRFVENTFVSRHDRGTYYIGFELKEVS